jgi:hypothetical protein
MSILSGTSNSGNIFFGDSGDNDVGFITYEHNNERMLFGAGGNHTLQVGGSEVVVNNDSDDVDFRVESNATTHALFVDGGSDVVRMGTSSGSAKLNIETSAAIVGCLVTCTSASYDANIINLVASRDTTNETYNILRGQNGAGFAIAIRDSGNVENVNNSYGSSSDERIKQNIVDANSQWDDIKALKIRNYKLKKEVAKGVDKTYIGVVAQEVETAGMNGLIGGKTAEDKETVALSSDFGTLYEDGDVLPEGKAIGDIKTVDQKVKSVKYSILYMKAIKALQEAQTRIETLETKVKALEDA